MRVVSAHILVLGLGLLQACSVDDTERGTVQRSDAPFNNAGTLGATAGTSTAGATAGISSPAGQAAAGLGAGGTGIPRACAEGMAQVSRVTPDVVLVVDGSCSMSTDYPSDGSTSNCQDNPNSRWSALRGALLDPTGGIVTRLAGVIRFGLVIFGTEPSCPLPLDVIDPALDNHASIDMGFPTVPPGMLTPTGATLDWVYENMADTSQVLDLDLGPQIVLLATDGEPNSCDSFQTNYQPSIDAALKGQSKGITTYVISLASSAGEFHDHLQDLADIGAGGAQGSGTGTLYEPSTPEELAAELEILIGGVVGCDMALNGSVQAGSECLGEVALNGQPLGCGEPDGWILTDPRHIQLQGAACDQFKSSKDAQLRAAFPCDVFIPD